MTEYANWHHKTVIGRTTLYNYTPSLWMSRLGQRVKGNHHGEPTWVIRNSYCTLLGKNRFSQPISVLNFWCRLAHSTQFSEMWLNVRQAKKVGSDQGSAGNSIQCGSRPSWLTEEKSSAFLCVSFEDMAYGSVVCWWARSITMQWSGWTQDSGYNANVPSNNSR